MSVPSKNRELVPELRFPEFVEDWEEAPLREFMVERNTQSPESETHPLMAFIAHKGVAPKGDRYNRGFLVKDSEGKKYKRTEYGDFIYSSNNLETGSIGFNSLGSASISPVYSIFYFKENCNSEFIGRMLSRKPFIYEMTRYRQGVVYGQWRIHESSFLGIKQAVPHIDEQNKIANFLTAVDGRIGQLIQKKALLEDYKKGVMQQLFSQAIRFKDDNGNDFPDWEEKKLGEVCKIKTGKKDVNEGNPNGQYPFFTCARQHTFSDNYSFDTTAILIAGNGEVGHCQLYKGKFEAYQRTYVLSEFSRSVEYIFPYLNFFFRRTVDQQKQMGAMPYIKLGMLSDFPVPVPSDPVEQTKIARFVAAIDRKIESVASQITETQAFKRGLLQQMFV